MFFHGVDFNLYKCSLAIGVSIVPKAMEEVDGRGDGVSRLHFESVEILMGLSGVVALRGLTVLFAGSLFDEGVIVGDLAF